MPKLFSLDERLLACASLVSNGARLADIGTDHAYLPIWLLINNKISYAIACDINQSPLDSGRENADKYTAENIEFRLGNGLAPIKEKDNITDIVIAGMGGEIISEILKASPIAKKQGVNLILQPMTKSEELIKFLYNEGFEIDSQICTVSHNKCYTIIRAIYSGNKTQVNQEFCYTGKLSLTDKHSVRFLEQHIRHLENKGKGNPNFLDIANKLREKLL